MMITVSLPPGPEDFREGRKVAGMSREQRPLCGCGHKTLIRGEVVDQARVTVPAEALSGGCEWHLRGGPASGGLGLGWGSVRNRIG